MLKNSVEVVPLALLVLLVWLSISPSSGSNARQGPPGNNAWTLLADTTNGVSSDMFFSGSGPASAQGVSKVYWDRYLNKPPVYMEQDPFTCSPTGLYNGEWKLSEANRISWPSSDLIGKTFENSNLSTPVVVHNFNF